MMTDEEYNRDGSWFFPPRPRSAVQYVAFWSKVPVPDEVLTRLIKDFRQRTLDDLTTHSSRIESDFESIWRADNPAHFAGRVFQSLSSEARTRKKAAFEAYALSRADESPGSKPGQIDPMDARTIARSARMYATPKGFSSADRDWVWGYPIGLTTGPTTVQGIQDTYKLRSLQNALQTPTDTITDVLAELGTLRDEVRQLRQQLDSMDNKIGMR